MLVVGARAGKMASNKAFRMAQEQLNKKIAERFAERQASALMIASGPVAATLSYMCRATMDTELAETNARATAVFSVNAGGCPKVQHLGSCVEPHGVCSARAGLEGDSKLIATVCRLSM